MAMTRSLDLAVWRNDDVYELPIQVVGLDLTGVSLAAQVRGCRDNPVLLANLAKVTNGNAEGLRVAGVALVDGKPVTDLRLRLNKSTRQTLPYTGEMGDDTPLEWVLLIAGRTRLTGRVWMLAHAYGSDGAPANRPEAYGGRLVAGGATGSATLVFAGEDIVSLAIDGTDVAVAAASQAEGAMAAAQSSAALSEAAGGPTYASTAAGLSATPEGGSFAVAEGGGLVAIYRRIGGAAVFQRRLATTEALAAPSGSSRVGSGLLALDRSLAKSLAYLGGVDPFTTASQQSKLEDALAIAAQEGYAVEAHPDADYRHDGLILIDGVRFDGQGCTFTQLSNGNGAIRLIGSGGAIRNLRHLGCATARADGERELHGVWVDGATDFVIEHVTVDGTAPDRGFPSGGFMFDNARRGVIRSTRAIGQLADGHHCTRGSRDLLFYDPRSIGCWDDGFACVSYLADGDLVRDISVFGGIARDCHARGFSVVGGKGINYYSPRAYGVAAAAAYLQVEDGDFTTHGIDNCHVRDLYAENCVTGIGQGASFTSSVVVLGGVAGSSMADGVQMPRVCMDCSVSGRIEGLGARGFAGADLSSRYVIRPRLDLNMRNLLGGAGGQPAGMVCGAYDAETRLVISNVGGAPYVTLAGASGRHRLFLDATDTRVASPTNPANVHFDGGADLETFDLEGTLRNAPGQMFGLGGINPAKLAHRRVSYNGALQADKAYG